MRTEFILAIELAATFTPAFGLLCASLALEKWKANFLLCGQIVAFVLGLSGFAMTVTHRLQAPNTMDTASLAWQIDLPTSCILLGITFIACIVIVFSERYLAGDKTRLKFLGYLSFLSTAAACLTVTDNLFLAFACWHAMSLALWGIMLLQPDRRKSAGMVLGHQLVSDIAMLLALVLLYTSTRISDYSQLFDGLPNLKSNLSLFGTALPISQGTAIALLLVFSFCIKSALFPFHRWLVATLDAPTPLSGLLHAGVVNVSAIVAWRMMPLLQEHSSVLLLWGCLAMLSAVVGTLIMSAQPDIKRKLVYSTVGQMGFMSLQCASGAIAAALFHMIAHGFFKCYMFLASGSAVSEGLNKRKFGYAENQPASKKPPLTTLLFLSSVGLVLCAFFYVICPSNAWTSISAITAACALLCSIPALHRIEFQTLSCFWIATMAVALAAGILSSQFDHLIQVSTRVNWLLPAGLAFFVLIATALEMGKKTPFAKALYVHSLSGFYIDELMAAGLNKKERSL